MQEYDATLKTLLTRSGSLLVSTLTGSEIQRWHNIELPKASTLKVDLLGETSAKQLVHIELQSSNDPAMMLRMAEYAILINRRFHLWPDQFVLYIGQARLRMPAQLNTRSLSFSCRIVDVRELDAEPLLASPRLEDNVVAILANLRNEREAVKRILTQIARADPTRRALALTELTILSGLRKLESVIDQEAHNMPILDDIMDHDLIGPAIRRGLEQGERRIVLSQVNRRFGPIPAWATQRLNALASPELEKIGLKLLDAETLEELLG